MDDGEILSLAQSIRSQTEGKDPSPRMLLQQALERLIVSMPDRAMETMTRYADEISCLEPAGALGNLLGRILLERKLYNEAVRLLRLGSKVKLVTEAAIATRLAKALMQGDQTELAAEVLEAALAIDPACSGAVRGLYECACKNGQPQEADRQLARLAALDPSYSTAAFVYKERQKIPAAQGSEVRIALASSYVLDWLVPYLDRECRGAGLIPRFYQAPFNQYTQVILNSESELYQFNPEIIFMALAIEDLIPLLGAGMKETDLIQARCEIFEQVIGLVREIESRCGAMVVVHEFVLGHQGGCGILDNRLPDGLLTWLGSLNRTLAEELKRHERAYQLPLESVIGWVGKERSINPKMSYMASMRIAEPALPYLARYSMRYIKPLKGLTRKCVVLDLDGTLWGGIVGEVGPEGVNLGLTAPGIEYVEFQRTLLGLLRRGILLAVCSKNNPEDALPVIREHPQMVLREEHFAAMRINWRNKADNIREIAQELNIGLDSLVFIDDNPNERELVKQLLPEVLTVELPKDASLYRRTIEAMTDFELLALTKEDEMRVAQYRANSKRQAAKSTAASLDEYLRSLEVQVAIPFARRGDLPRLVQLFNKTNQFNLTTRRYQADEVEALLASTDVAVYDLHVKDRFGDHGLVGAAVVRKERMGWRIDSLLLSCRVMGLGIETAFLERICSDAAQTGIRKMIGEFIATKKNQPVKEFYAQHGFGLLKEDGGLQEWALDLFQAAIAKPAWILTTGERTFNDR